MLIYRADFGGITSVPQNGETNQKFGIYKTVCCGAEIVINVGATFPDCPNHRKLTTIWKAVVDEKIFTHTLQKPQSDPAVETHIENRRLFNLAAGKIRLGIWEQQHLHRCELCQGVLNVLVKQPINLSLSSPRKPASAA
jgi:hypothetical protein